MRELKLYEFQAKQIEDTLRIVANTMHCHEKETCLDRDVMVSLQMIRNVLAEKIDEQVKR